MFKENNSEFPLWRVVCPAFGKDIKKEIRKQQDNICFICGEKVRELEVHHRMPQCRGGSDRIENAVGLCSGEHGRGENSPDDCHQRYDLLAIENGLFLGPDGKLVTRDKMSDECFKYEDHNRMPERRCTHEHHKLHKKRHRR